jgi:hypothetical protein
MNVYRLRMGAGGVQQISKTEDGVNSPYSGSLFHSERWPKKKKRKKEMSQLE